MTTRKFISEAIVGPFNAAVRHSHGDLGPAPEAHEHAAQVKLTFRAENERGITFVLNPPTQRKIEDRLNGFFKQDFTDMAMETIAQRLFEDLEDSVVPELQNDPYNIAHPFSLQAVSLVTEYDGTLDHPTQTMEFVARTL